MLVIDADGGKLGEFMTRDAIDLAREQGLDLVEVAPNARPPVCRIVDYGRLKYDKKKKEAVARKNQVIVQLKEVKLRPKTDLEAGDKVKVSVRFRGLEMAHRDIGAKQCLRVHESVQDVGLIEQQPRMDGRLMVMILAPIKKKG